MQYDHIEVPESGESITVNADHSLNVPAQPIRKSRPHCKSEVVEQLEEMIPGATLVGTKGFGEAVIRHMDD